MMPTRLRTALTITALFSMLVCPIAAPAAGANGDLPFVRVSQQDQRYFELADGRPYIPIGLNMIGPPDADHFDGMAEWLKNLSANGGNFIRVWLGRRFFDVEHQRSGQFDEERAKRIEQMLAICRRHNIRVKMCLEDFRNFDTGPKARNSKPLHAIANGGPAKDIADFFNGERSREQFKRKLAWYAKRFGDNPTVFGWELWNEVDCVAGGDYMAWSEIMLAELHRVFPKNLAMQSMGSFDTDAKRERYRRLAVMAGNDVAQVHRYLDLGARLDVCKGPVDVLAAEAAREILAAKPGRPVLLAESGAVEPSHSGPFKLYEQDKAGIILHDVLFAPFFAGAAGPGHCWHWDQYVSRNDLWRQFRGFSQAVEGIHPAAEGFEPLMIEHPRLRVYVLKGKTTTLAWCRDKQNTWMSELRDAQPPETISDAAIEPGEAIRLPANARIRIYDPWKALWTEGVARDVRISLPPFSRSLVLRIPNTK